MSSLLWNIMTAVSTPAAAAVRHTAARSAALYRGSGESHIGCGSSQRESTSLRTARTGSER